MGRHCGFIAMNAALAARHVDICLLPEMDIDLVRPENVHIVFSSSSAETLFRDENVTKTKAENDEQTLDHLQQR